MKYPHDIALQLKKLTSDRLARALERDGWCFDETQGAIRIYRHPDGRHVAIHYHSGKTYGRKRLRDQLLKSIGWSVDDLKRLKLIKRVSSPQDSPH